jgi:hypothetical protein
MGNFFGCSCKSNGGKPVTSLAAKRGCTDVLFLILFGIAFAGMFAVFGYTADQGANPTKIINGVDWQGKICGEDTEVKDKPFAAWPGLPTSIDTEFKVCVAQCSDASDAGVLYPTVSFIDRYCMPNPSSTATIPGFDDHSQETQRAVADLNAAQPVIFAAAGVAIIGAFLYTWSLKHFAKILAWGAIFITFAAIVVFGWSLLTKAKEMKDEAIDPDRAHNLEYMAYVAIATGALFLLVMIVLRKRINVAVEVVKEASRALSDMRSMVFFPVFPFVFAVLFFLFWIYGAMYIFSVTVALLFLCYFFC